MDRRGDGKAPSAQNLQYPTKNHETWHTYTLLKEGPKNVKIT